MRNRSVWISLLCLFMAASCSSQKASVNIPAQQWNGLNVELQSRPAPVVPGMNEFIVIINRSGARPAHNLIVSIRISDDQPWKQMIQDGYMGVFRRAVKVNDPASQMLNVQIQHGDDVGYLRFPLIAPPPAAKSQPAKTS